MTLDYSTCALQFASGAPIPLNMETRRHTGRNGVVTRIPEPVVPLAVLLSADSQQILDVLVSEVGASVVESEVTQVRYVPKRLCVVQYKVAVDWGGATSTETFVASTGLNIPGDVPQVEVDDSLISVWRYPRDPFLPGLEPANDPVQVANLLGDLGAPQRRTSLRRRSYRPGRRAVIEAVSPSTRLFIKVVRPSTIGELQNKHHKLAQQLPVPISHGWSSDLGLIALEARAGKTLRRVLDSGSRRLPSPQELIDLLSRFPVDPELPEVADGPVSAARSHAKLLTVLAPGLSAEIGSAVNAIESVEDTEPTGVHGDFHSSQILVKGDQIVGLVDVDNAGRGQAADDYASLLGQLAVLAMTSSRRKTISTYSRALLDAFDKMTDPRDLRLRTAAVILGHATGPFRVQRATWPAATRRRIKLTQDWIDAASTANRSANGSNS